MSTGRGTTGRKLWDIKNVSSGCLLHSFIYCNICFDLFHSDLKESKNDFYASAAVDAKNNHIRHKKIVSFCELLNSKF